MHTFAPALFKIQRSLAMEELQKSCTNKQKIKKIIVNKVASTATRPTTQHTPTMTRALLLI